MLAYTVRRIVVFVPTLFITLTLIFVLTRMLPGSPVYIGELAEQPSPHSSIRNLVGSAPATLEEGKALFAKGCMHCHGAEGKGGSGPNLLAFISNSTEWDFMATA